MTLCLGTACFLSFQVRWIVAQYHFKHFANSAHCQLKEKFFYFSERSIAALSVLQDWLKTQLKPPTLSTELARLFAGLHHVVWKSLAVSSLCIAWAMIVTVFTATGILFKKIHMTNWAIRTIYFLFINSIVVVVVVVLLRNNQCAFSFCHYFFIHPVP